MRNKRERGFYPLAEVRNLINEGKYVIKPNARDGAKKCFGWDDEIIIKVYRRLKFSDWYKYMESDNMPGVMLDVYKIYYTHANVYTHFYIHDEDLLIINSFHEA